MRTKTQYTADELFQMPDDGYRTELVKGELVRMTPVGGRHAQLTGIIYEKVKLHVAARGLGVVCVGDPGFILSRDPDTVRAPDVAFVSHERIPKEGVPRGYWSGAPDLAVEVVSPHDRYVEILEKIKEYLEAGTRLVWVVDDGARTVTVHRSPKEIETVTEDDALTGGDVLPGFSCLVSEIFSE
ncbi:MAG: Uma2 family endonuclease [Acidobacteria bacterium]|nr:Uma2 family endonuclease [Acidobacteriota bacterium]